MSTNFFPILQNSLIVYKEALNNINGINFLKMPKVEPKQSQSTNQNNAFALIQHKGLPEILFISSYPPRECGIATYTNDLRNALLEKFGHSFSLNVCALESEESDYNYPDEVKYILKTNQKEHYSMLAHQINANKNVAMIFLEHEFGLFGGKYGDYLLKFMSHIKKPIATTFHTVLPNPNDKLKKVVRKIVEGSDSIIVMTHNSAAILIKELKETSEHR